MYGCIIIIIYWNYFYIICMINLIDLLYEDVNIINKMWFLWGMKVVIMVEIKLYNCNFVI